MKIFILECTEDELRANRGIMDAIVDACQGVLNTFYGTTNPCSTTPCTTETELEAEEDGEVEE